MSAADTPSDFNCSINAFWAIIALSPFTNLSNSFLPTPLIPNESNNCWCAFLLGLIEAANAGYNSDGYQEALKKLDGSAVREFRYVEMV